MLTAASGDAAARPAGRRPRRASRPGCSSTRSAGSPSSPRSRCCLARRPRRLARAAVRRCCCPCRSPTSLLRPLRDRFTEALAARSVARRAAKEELRTRLSRNRGRLRRSVRRDGLGQVGQHVGVEGVGRLHVGPALLPDGRRTATSAGRRSSRSSTRRAPAPLRRTQRLQQQHLVAAVRGDVAVVEADEHRGDVLGGQVLDREGHRAASPGRGRCSSTTSQPVTPGRRRSPAGAAGRRRGRAPARARPGRAGRARRAAPSAAPRPPGCRRPAPPPGTPARRPEHAGALVVAVLAGERGQERLVVGQVDLPRTQRVRHRDAHAGPRRAGSRAARRRRRAGRAARRRRRRRRPRSAGRRRRISRSAPRQSARAVQVEVVALGEQRARRRPSARSRKYGSPRSSRRRSTSRETSARREHVVLPQRGRQEGRGDRACRSRPGRRGR